MKKNTIYINNGFIERGYPKDKEIPKGWKKGRLKSVINKIKKTCLEKYGYECSFQNEKVKEKIKKTFINKYGTDNPSKNKLVQEKKKKTFLKKYGCEYGFQAEEVKKKIKETLLKRYGKENYTQTKEYKEKTKKTNLKKYNCEYPIQNEEIKEKIKKINLKKYGKNYACQNEEVKKKIKETVLKKYGIEYACQLPQCIEANYSNESKESNNFAKLLEKNDIKYIREFPIKKYRYDFKIGNILIEINPTITHNSYKGIFNSKPKDKYYHYNKTKLAYNNRYKCIQIFDWMDEKKIIALLKNGEDIIISTNIKPKLFWCNPNSKKTFSNKFVKEKGISKEYLIEKYYYPIYDDGNSLRFI